MQGWYCWYFTSRCVPFCRFEARDARHHGLFGPEEQLCAWLVLLVTTPLVLCSLFVFTPKMLGIMAGMTQVDSCIEEYREIGLFWEMTPLFPYSALWFDSGYIFRSVFSGLVYGFDCRKLLTFRSCSSSLVVEFPVVVQRPFPMTTETPQLLLNTVIDAPVAQVVQVRTSSVAPCIWESLVRCSVFAFGVQEYGYFWEVSVCYTPWFDSGYTFGVSLRGFMEDFHTFSTRLTCLSLHTTGAWSDSAD